MDRPRRTPPPRTTVQCFTGERPLRIAPVGDVDLLAKPRLDAAMATVATAGAVDVLVDLRAATFLDSAGLGFLIELHRQVVAGGNALTLADPNPLVMRVLELTGLARVIPIVTLGGPELAQGA